MRCPNKGLGDEFKEKFMSRSAWSYSFHDLYRDYEYVIEDDDEWYWYFYCTTCRWTVAGDGYSKQVDGVWRLFCSGCDCQPSFIDSKETEDRLVVDEVKGGNHE